MSYGKRDPTTYPVQWWDSTEFAQTAITHWADTQFPNRTWQHAIHKLTLHEIPELLVHIKQHGTEGIGEELADCFILLLDLASLWNVNVATAIKNKMDINYKREWSIDPVTGVTQHVENTPAKSTAASSRDTEMGYRADDQTADCRRAFVPGVHSGDRSMGHAIPDEPQHGRPKPCDAGDADP